jgi:hypothetical protein
MKYIIIVVLLTMSCSKDSNNETCWNCRISVNGQDEWRKVCGDGETPPQIFDNMGNPYPQACQKL